ncbi:MAG: phosphatase PAP2 family protein [Bacteroidia bacterium]
METRFAKIISLLLHPLLMPTYGFALLFFTDNYIGNFTEQNYKYLILLVTFFFTFVLPALNAVILLKLNRISSLEMDDPRERVVPYGSTALYYFTLFYLFWRNQFPSIFQILILGAGLSILLSLFINFRWKISAHSVGIGGIAGAVLGIMYRMQIDLELIFICVILAAGLIGYARLKLAAHGPSQVYSGFILGFITELLLMIFYQ